MIKMYGIYGLDFKDNFLGLSNKSSNLLFSSKYKILNNKNNLKEENTLILGYNILSKFENDIFKEKSFVFKNNLHLIFNGEIYNRDYLKEFLKKDNQLSDEKLTLELIDNFYNKDLLTAVKKAIDIIDGVYSFAVFDEKNLLILRDSLGVKPLYYLIKKDFKIFSSERAYLNSLNLKDFKSLKPGNILYNWGLITPSKNPWNIKKNVNIDDLEKILKSAIFKRVKDLDEVALMFSGGVDCSLIALILKDISLKKDLKIKLYSVGAENSKDLLFGKKAAKLLDLPFKFKIINEKIIRENIRDVLLSIGENNLMKIGVGMMVHLTSKMIYEDGLNVALSGQGADELFGGYNRYLRSDDLDKELRYDVENMYKVNLERDYAISIANKVKLRLPFLDKKLVEFALNIPTNKKISSSEDNLRKNILRDLAFKLGLNHEIAYRPKKAAQYGTGIDKILRKKVLKDFDVDTFLKLI